ncbi:MAG: PepSY-associated TM helix domain-containing protein, partial [Bacteroidota bacterium]
MKVFFRRIHLYLGLAAGLVILTCCLTGAILVFEKDLQMAMNKKRYYVEAGKTKLSVDELAKKVKDSFPTAKINGVKLYEDAKRSAEINVSIAPKKEFKTEAQKPTKESSTTKVGKKDAAPQRQPGFTIFINPYTGEILQKYSYRETWFYTAFALHRWLLGSDSSIGKTITGVSTLFFVFILITGIVLWWPKTKKVMKQRLKIKWTAGWKRINHDLHLVFGFYSAIFLFIFAFTALAWSFEWFNNGIYKVTNSPLKNPPPPQSTYMADAKKLSFEEALATAKTVYSGVEFYNISMPKDSLDAVNVTALSKHAAHESASDAVYIDQYSGKVISKMEFGDRSLGARVRSTFKPVHTGSIWGTPSKIIAFIVCLLGVTFPITGTIMWINRTRKK